MLEPIVADPDRSDAGVGGTRSDLVELLEDRLDDWDQRLHLLGTVLAADHLRVKLQGTVDKFLLFWKQWHGIKVVTGGGAGNHDG